MEYKEAYNIAKNVLYLLEKNKNKITEELCKEDIKELENNNYDYKQLKKDILSNYGKIFRIKKRIKKMINSNNCYFVTYTIEDKYMNRDHVRKLKDINKGLNYIINVDYGKSTNRKHYHGIIESSIEPPSWNYGFCKIDKIRITENTNIQAIAKYINKLTNHTIKNSTKQEKIIYSRNKKK